MIFISNDYQAWTLLEQWQREHGPIFDLSCMLRHCLLLYRLPRMDSVANPKKFYYLNSKEHHYILQNWSFGKIGGYLLF